MKHIRKGGQIVSQEHRMLVSALRMALRKPESVGQRSLSIVLGAGGPPFPAGCRSVGSWASTPSGPPMLPC